MRIGSVYRTSDKPALDKNSLRIFGKTDGVAQNYDMSESSFSEFTRYEVNIQGIQYGSCSGLSALKVGAMENLQILQASKTLQAIAGAAMRIQDESAKDTK